MPDAAVFDVTRFFTSLDEEGSVKKNNYPGCGWPRVAVSIVKQMQGKYRYGHRPEGNNTPEHDNFDIQTINSIINTLNYNAPYSKRENEKSRQITDIQNALVTAIARENVFSLLIYCDTDDNIRNYWGQKNRSAMRSDLIFVKSMTSTAVQKHLHYLMARNMHMSAPSDHQLRDVWFYKQQYVALGTINQWCVRRYLQSVQGAEEQLETQCGIDRKWVNLRPEWFDTSTALLTFARLYVRNSEYANNNAQKTPSSTRNDQEKSDVDTENIIKKQLKKIKELTEKNLQLQQDNREIETELDASKTKVEANQNVFLRLLQNREIQIESLENDKVKLQEELDILKQAKDGKKEESVESSEEEEFNSEEASQETTQD